MVFSCERRLSSSSTCCRVLSATPASARALASASRSPSSWQPVPRPPPPGYAARPRARRARACARRRLGVDEDDGFAGGATCATRAKPLLGAADQRLAQLTIAASKADAAERRSPTRVAHQQQMRADGCSTARAPSSQERKCCPVRTQPVLAAWRSPSRTCCSMLYLSNCSSAAYILLPPPVARIWSCLYHCLHLASRILLWAHATAYRSS